MYAATQNVVTTLSQGLPVLLLTHFYGIAVAGAYAFGVGIVQTPMGLLLRALREVFLQKAGETQYRGDSLTPLYVKTTAGLFALGFFPSLVLFIWAPQLFTWVFGSQWHTAGEFAQSLVLWLFFGFCNVPAVKCAQVIRIQRSLLFYDLAMLTGRALILVLCGQFLGSSQTILLFSLFGAAMNLFLILFVGYKVMKKEGRTNWGSLRDSLMEG